MLKAVTEKKCFNRLFWETQHQPRYKQQGHSIHISHIPHISGSHADGNVIVKISQVIGLRQ